MKSPIIDTAAKRALISTACTDWAHLPTLTLARKLYGEHPHLWPTLDACNQAIRTRRGAHGRAKRATHVTHPRPAQAAGFTWRFPTSIAKPWTPFVLDAERTLILSDIHIPFHDTPAIRAVVNHERKWKPDCILINGDLCDFFSISRFERNPSVSNLKKEIDLTRQFLGWLRQQFPRARIIYKFGNHDEWFSRYIWRKAPELWDLDQLHLENILQLPNTRDGTPGVSGIEFLTNQERITLGYLDVLHGHELGKGSIAPPVNPARGAFMKTVECTLVGHLHRTSHHQERSARGRNIACWSTGCLCGLWPDYAKVNKWDHSAARVDLKGNDFSVTPLRLIDGKVV